MVRIVNAQPIKLQDGTIFGFACGKCGRVTRQQDVEVDETDPNPFTAAKAAEQCCICSMCKGVKEQPLGSSCHRCLWVSWFAGAWMNIGTAMKLGISNPIVWEIVEDQLDYGTYMHALETTLQRYPAYADDKTHCAICQALLTHGQRDVHTSRCQACAQRTDPAATLPRAVALYLPRVDGKILAVSRRGDPTSFGLPGGKVDPGETPIQALRREVFEETGLRVVCPELKFECVCVGETSYWTEVYTVLNVLGTHPQTQEPIEIAWVDPPVLCDGPFGEFNAKLFAEMEKQRKDRHFFEFRFSLDRA